MIEPSSQPDRAPTKTRLRILQTIAWINVAAGAFLACGGLLLAFAVFASDFADQPTYLRGLFVLIPLCIALAFILTGRAFLKRPSQRSAVSAASGFAVLVWFVAGSVFERESDSHEGDLIHLIAGILFAYACFLAIKRLVIKPHFAGTVE